jgi:hypothetical protein
MQSYYNVILCIRADEKLLPKTWPCQLHQHSKKHTKTRSERESSNREEIWPRILYLEARMAL